MTAVANAAAMILYQYGYHEHMSVGSLFGLVAAATILLSQQKNLNLFGLLFLVSMIKSINLFSLG